MAQPGQAGELTQPMTNPMANRLRNAPSSAAGLSGKDMGNIIATEMAPKTNPLIVPAVRFDILRLKAPNRYRSMLIFRNRSWDAPSRAFDERLGEPSHGFAIS